MFVGVGGVLLGLWSFFLIINLPGMSYLFNILYAIYAFISGVLFFYFGFKINKYLYNSSKTLIYFIIISLGINVLFKVFIQDLVAIIGTVLIAWYLVYSVKKISKKSDLLNKKKLV